MMSLRRMQYSSWSVDRPWIPRDWQRWALLAGSSMLIGYGLAQRNRKGMASSLAGAALLQRGVAMTRDPDAGIVPDLKAMARNDTSVTDLLK